MHVRKRSSAMTPAERTMFINVMTTLINAPGDANPYGNMVNHHGMMHNMHGSMSLAGRQRFLSWHRVYLLKVEQMGKVINPAFFIPYWELGYVARSSSLVCRLWSLNSQGSRP